MIDIELIDSAEVERMASVSRRTIDRMEVAKTFPRRVRIGHSTVRWVRSEVEAWVQKQVDARKAG